MKMNAHPSAMSKISHQVSVRGLELSVAMVGVSMPETVGSGMGVLVPEATGTATRSERQTPSPESTDELSLHVAVVQVPLRKT